MDPNEPEPLMRLPISVEYGSLRYDTSVLIDSASTLNFASQEFLTRNGVVGECVRLSVGTKSRFESQMNSVFLRTNHFHLQVFSFIK